MATIETLIVQIFDRKRQIIDQLKQRKLLYDQHLASKLLIQGITPPNWLLPPDLPPYQSHFSGLDKAGLFSGLLNPRPGPVASCPVSRGLSYDNPVSAVNDSVIDEASDEDGSSHIPLYNGDDTEDRADIVLSSHADVNACPNSYVPMSPEDQSYAKTCDTHPKQDQSLVKMQRSRSRQRALEVRSSAKTSGKSRLGMNNVDALSQTQSCQGDEQLYDAGELVRSFSLSNEICNKEKASTEVRSSNASGCLLTLYANNEDEEVHLGDDSKNEKNSSVYVGMITRSSSQCRESKDVSSVSKALEYGPQLDGSTKLVQSDKVFALPTEICSQEEETRTLSAERNDDTPDISLLTDLTMNNNGGGLCGNQSCQGDEEVNGLSFKPFSASTDIYYNKESPIKVTSPDSCAGSLTQSANNEANEVHGGDNREAERSDRTSIGRISRSSEFCQHSAGVSSRSKNQDPSEQLHESREYPESHEASAMPTRIYFLEEPGTKTCLTEGISDACNVLLSRDLAIKNDAGVPSGDNRSQGDEQLQGLESIESRELLKHCSLPTKTCDKEEVSIRLTNSSSFCQLFKDSPITRKSHGSSEQLDASREICGSFKFSAFPAEICSWKEADVGPCLTRDTCDGSDIYLSNSADCKSKDQQTRDDDERKSNIFTAGKSSPSTGGVKSSLGIPSSSKTSGPCFTKETCDDCDAYLTNSADCKSKDRQTRDVDEEKKSDIFTAGKITPSTGGVQSSSGIPSSDKTSGPCLTKETWDGCDAYLTTSADCKSKDRQTRDDDDERKSNIFAAGKSWDGCDVQSSSGIPSIDKTSGPCLTKETWDGCDAYLTTSADCKSKDRQTSDDDDERKSNIFAAGKSSPFSGGVQFSSGIPSSDKTSGPCLTKETWDGCDAYLTNSADCYSKDRQTRDDEEERRSKIFTADKITPFTGGRQLSSSIRSSCETSGPCLAQETCDGSDICLTNFVDCKSNDGKTRDDDEETKSIIFTSGKITPSTGGLQSSSGIPSSSNTSGHGHKIDDTRGSLEYVKQTASAIGNFATVETEHKKGEMQLEDSGRNAVITMTYEHEHVSASRLSIEQQRETVEPTDRFSKQLEVEIEEPGSSDLCPASIIGEMINGQDVDDSNSSEPLIASNKVTDCEIPLQAEKKLKYSIVSPVIERMDIDEVDQAMPEFERFGPPSFGDGFQYENISIPFNIMDHTSLHEQISRSASFTPPLSPFPVACKSSVPSRHSKMNDQRISLHEQQYRSALLRTPSSPLHVGPNFGLKPSIYSSVPNGLLENIDSRNDFLPAGSDLQRKYHSDIFSFPRFPFGMDLRKPFLSPIENGFENVASKSGGSEKVISGNPELTCFTILEDPESPGEDVEEPNIGLEGTDLCMRSSSIKEPLRDITLKDNTSLVQDQAVEKRSFESVSTETGISEICDIDFRASDVSHRQSRRTTRGKENKGFSNGGNSFKKNTKAHSTRFSKEKLSVQSSLRARGQSMSEKEPKHNNIVSNVKSFIPLVQQKQAAAAAPVKRDVKVKALEAAEAAKRLAEKKENERKQKKEALKTERARLEQENLKQLELAKKLKDEAKRKRNAENAAKKRQREEGEKVEKERKRKRVEDARCQQMQAQEKILAWREESRYGAEEERTVVGKELNKKAPKEPLRANEASISCNPVNESVASGSGRTESVNGTPSLNDGISSEPSVIGKVDSIVTAESSTPNITRSDKSMNRNSLEQSYDISPYHCSDDEEEEDDEMPNKKLIPSWASKSCVLEAVHSLKHVDPDTIFLPGSFCNMDDVLKPRRLSQNSKMR